MKYPFVEDVLTAKILAKTVPVGALEQAIEEAKRDNQCANTVVAMLAYFARVSNPSNQTNFKTAEKLLAYCMRLSHWSVFTMANIVIEVECPRDIGRQVLRHRFDFQEFCVDGDTLVTVENLDVYSVQQEYKESIEGLYRLQQDGKLSEVVAKVFDEDVKLFIVRPIKEVFKTGVKPVFKVLLENGRSITATKEHKFLTKDGFKTLEDAVGLSVSEGTAVANKAADIFCDESGVSGGWSKVAKVEYVGEVMTYDMEVDHPSHNYVGNGIVTHNSQRYSLVDELGISFAIPKLRTQDFKNRQNSFEVEDTDERFDEYVAAVERRIDAAKAAYDEDIALGVAKETARKGLPEGYTMTRMVMNGTVRQWIHYLAVRDDEGVTQWEHVLLARKIRQALAAELSVIFGAVEEASKSAGEKVSKGGA